METAMNRSTLFKISVILLTSSWPVTAAVHQGKGPKKKQAEAVQVVHDDRGQGDDQGSYFKKHGYEKLHIPPGHYPPPGECRIWFPGRPPGHQPPPMKCDRARAEVPPGAWVIRRPADDRDHVHVAVYDERRPGSVLVVGQFKIATGVFVSVVVDH
jgi:hypothetical protein